ncbi:MAG: FecR domain-containing protein [Bacteroidales bacterium]|nr:FecR domain-containing protein [Bacteroidales bacterium]
MLFKDEKSDQNLTAYKEIKIPKGKRFHIQLSDGTHIWVNSESTLKYPEVFSGDDRKVYLEGEAYFDVTENKSKPFLCMPAK